MSYREDGWASGMGGNPFVRFGVLQDAMPIEAIAMAAICADHRSPLGPGGPARRPIPWVAGEGGGFN